ncbi:hypothetical protein ABPG74_011312 [Tetrahymena malaccensis]
MCDKDLQYLQRLLKGQKKELALQDYLISVQLIKKLCDANCSSVKISDITKKCRICQKKIDQCSKKFCDCFFHEECFQNYYYADYVKQNQEEFSSCYSQISNQNERQIDCKFCNQNIYRSLQSIFKNLNYKNCSHQQCRRRLDLQYIEYNCGCEWRQRIHKDCFIFQYIHESNFDMNQMACHQCGFKMQFDQSQFNYLQQILKYYCNKCSQKNLSFDEIIFCNCGQCYCQSCFYEQVRDDCLTQLLKKDFYCYFYPQQKCIDQRQIQQFLKTNLGKQINNEINEQLSQEQIRNIQLVECPGFYFKDKNNPTIKIEKQSAQKYITMKRQSEFDEDVKKEYEKCLQKLQEKYEIIQCNNKFVVEFQEDDRIFVCNNCEYRDCRNKDCKSPHFNLSCEMFAKLKQFKMQNQQINNNQNAIYKVKYDQQIIIINEQFYRELKQNPDNQVELIEEIKNPFFQACNLPFDLFDPQYDKVWDQNRPQSFRGRINGRNIQYNYPIYKNLSGYGINIQKLYGQQDNMKWLSRDTDEDTYIVGYHGTKSIAAVQGIIANGFQAGARQACAGYLCPYTNTQVGAGVYFGASIPVAYGYTSAIQINNERYRIIFQCRLNSRTVKGALSVGTQNEYYVVNNPRDIKIYRILLIKE